MTKLNLGSGRMQLSGYVGIDIDPGAQPDLVCDACKLPYEDGSIESIWADQLLEHLPRHAPLLEWYRVLEPGGSLWLTVPDVEQVYIMWKHGMKWGPYSLAVDENYIDAMALGASHLVDCPEVRFSSTPHLSYYMRDMLVQSLLRAGFCNVTEVTASPVRVIGLGETMAVGYKPKEGE